MKLSLISSTEWDVFHVLLGGTFVSVLFYSEQKTYKTYKTYFFIKQNRLQQQRMEYNRIAHH